MKKKKTLKIISATAIAASAFVTAAPAEAATAAQADKLVQAAKAAGTILKWAISIEGTADGTTRPWTAYNNAKKAYDDAFKAVNTLPAAQKNKYLAELDEHVKLHINRTMAYIDAITAGENIRIKQKALSYQLDLNIVNEDTEKAYHELSTEIRKQAILLDRVYGQSTRDLIRSQYKQAAEKVRDNAMYPVTVKIALDLAQKALAANNTIQAEKYIAEAKKYIKYVDNSVIKNTLNNRLSTVETTHTPKVVKVSAAEPKRIKVEFNKAMLSGTGTNSAENTSNYAISSRSIKSVTLSDDKKSAIIELYDSLYTSTTYSVTVKKNVQTAAYEAIGQADSISSFTFSDTTKPTVSFVTTDSNGNLEIKFSEIIAAYSPLSVTLNGKTASFNSLYYDTDTAIVPKAELDRIGLQKGINYSIVVTGARDLVVNYPNTMNTYSGTFFYNSLADTSAPFVRNIVRTGERTFTIEFSETLVNLAASNLVIKKNDGTPVSISKVTDVSGNKTKFEVELNANVFGTNESSVYLNIQVKDYKDLANNVARTTDHSLTISKDLTPPTVIGAIYDRSNDEFQITFDKNVTTGKATKKFEVSFDAELLPQQPKLKGIVNNKLIIDAVGLKDGYYSIKVFQDAVQDSSSSKNGNSELTQLIYKKQDIQKPTVASVTEMEQPGKIWVRFSEAVKPETAELVGNYTLDDKPLPNGTDIKLNSTNDSVIITLPAGEITDLPSHRFTVDKVQDLSGNIMDFYSTNIVLTAN